jgi:hypothetical protein
MAGAGKKTFTSGEILTASDVNTYLMEQSVMSFAGTASRSSAIPTPSDGMVTYLKDLDRLDVHNGSSYDPVELGAWQTWAPTLSGGWLNGNGTWSAVYTQVGKTIHVRANFTLGSTTTKGTGMIMSFPVPSKYTNGDLILCNCYLSVAGGTVVIGIARVNNASTFRIESIKADSTYAQREPITATAPATWATGDTFAFGFTYERN